MCCRYCVKGLREKAAAVFPGGQKRGNPTMTTSTVTAMRKGDPQHMLREKTTSPPPVIFTAPS